MWMTIGITVVVLYLSVGGLIGWDSNRYRFRGPKTMTVVIAILWLPLLMLTVLLYDPDQ